MKSFEKFLLVLSCICLVSSTGWAAEETRTVVDGRGVEVQIPTEIERVVTVSVGLVESTMLVLGEEEKIVGIGSSSLQKVYNWTYTTVSGETYEYRGGMNPVTYLCPRLKDLPLVKESGSGINYETLAGLDPDLVILRVGEAGLRSMEDEDVQKTIRTIESLDIPVVVLKSYMCFDDPDLSTFSDEIRLIGSVFGKEERAIELADYIESQTQVVFERTKNIPNSERQTVLIFGPSAIGRKAGGAGSVQGTNTIYSYFIEEVVHAKNAYRDTGSTVIISEEQLLAIDPDVIILSAPGYHPVEELYTASYCQNIGELSAVKNRRAVTPPWTPSGGIRLEYPIHVMVIAKAAYPERFADIDLGEWLLDYYKKVYGVDDDDAKALRSAQWMDWTVESV